jgi:hypothetical protein
MALNGIEDTVRSTQGLSRNARQPAKANVVRYADDFVVTGATRILLEQRVKPTSEEFLAARALQLAPEKTSITHISQGFDFLGPNVRKLHGIRARCKRKFVVTTDSKHHLPIAPDLVQRNFTPTALNQVWTGDITYIVTDEGWLYLAAVIDLDPILSATSKCLLEPLQQTRSDFNICWLLRMIVKKGIGLFLRLLPVGLGRFAQQLRQIFACEPLKDESGNWALN